MSILQVEAVYLNTCASTKQRHWSRLKLSGGFAVKRQFRSKFKWVASAWSRMNLEFLKIVGTFLIPVDE
eukprot:SAG31_NODE_1869_length_7028_cov_2.847164_2_plen_69_part_00